MNTPPPASEQRTVITDIDIPFGRMVAVILKFMIASIPAAGCMYVISNVFGFLFAVALKHMGVHVTGLDGHH